MDMAHALVAVFVDIDHGVQQSVDAAVVARLDGHHRHAQHATQILVVEGGSAGLQLVVHVERHDHTRVYVDQFGGQVKIAFQIRGDHGVYHHIGNARSQMMTHVTLLGRVGREGVGAGQVGDLEAVAAVDAAADLGADGHAAVIAHVFVTARDGVEQRGFAAVGVAYQRHRDGSRAACHHFVDARATFCTGLRSSECVVPFRFPAGAVMMVMLVMMAAMSAFEVFGGLAVGEHLDHVGFAAAQRNVVAHDLVFDRVFQGRIQKHFDPLSADESHLHDAAAEASVAHHLDDRPRFAGFKFG